MNCKAKRVVVCWSRRPTKAGDFFIVSDDLYNQAVSSGALTKEGGIAYDQMKQFFPEFYQNSGKEIAKKLGVEESKVTMRVWSEKGYEQSIKTRGENFIINQ